MSQPPEMMSPAARAAPRVTAICARWPDRGDAAIARRLRALEAAGLQISIWALTPGKGRPEEADLQAPVHLAARHLSDSPGAALGAVFSAATRPGFGAALGAALSGALRGGGTRALANFGKVCALAQEADDADLFLAMEPGAPAQAARCAAALFGAPWGLRLHGPDYQELTDGALKLLAREAAPLIATAPSIAARLAKLAPDAKPLFLPDGLDFASPPAPPEHRTAHRGEFALEEVKLLAVGALTRRKGGREMLEALSEMPPGMHWSLDIVGDGPEQAALTELAERLELRARIRFLGALQDNATLKLMRESHIFLAPAGPAATGGQSGMPAALMDAALMQMAIVAARTPDLTGLFEQETSILFCRQGRASEMGEAIARACRDTSLRASLGAAARARALEMARSSAPAALKSAITRAIAAHRRSGAGESAAGPAMQA